MRRTRIFFKALRRRIGNMIFEHERPLDRNFDIILLVLILLSILLVMLESVASIRLAYGRQLRALEWIFTAIFTIEYLVRIIVARRPLKYIFSFFGLIDLLTILPSFLSLFFSGSQYLLVIRSLRLLRVFRIFKLARFLGEADILLQALKASRVKITVFIGAVITLVIIMGSFMYLVEGEVHGFTSIPQSIYWAIVTLTTVGYGDISPETPLGKFFASIVMILGYGIIAVPTGIVSVEIGNASRKQKEHNFVNCNQCTPQIHDADARYCKLCGEHIHCSSETVLRSKHIGQR